MAGAQPIEIEAGDVSTVNVNAPVSLTINKYEGEIGDETTPLDGATFTIKKIDLGANLDSLAGWEEVAAAQTALLDDTLPATTGTPWTLETVNGTDSISTGIDPTFTVGAYLVTETEATGYTVAKPFIVTLPFTNDPGSACAYERTVSPKNQIVSVTKTVVDSEAVLGSDIDYTISASIPAEPMTSLSIEDELAIELGQATNVLVHTEYATTSADITLVELADYTLANNGPGGVATDNDLSIILTPTGLSKLNDLRVNNPNLKLIVNFNTRVIVLPANGTIRNDAIVRYPNSTVTTTPTDPDNPIDDNGVETRLGTLTVNKVDSDEVLIADGTATFELWRCALNSDNRWAVSGTGPINVFTEASVMNVSTEADLDAYALSNPPVSSFETVAGQATLYGIRAFNFANGVATAGTSDICLVETVAPDGYPYVSGLSGTTMTQHIRLIT